MLDAPLDDHGFARALLAEFLRGDGSGEGTEAAFLEQVLQRLVASREVATAAVVTLEDGHWHASALAGRSATLPYAALHEVLDAEAPARHESWWLGPLGPPNELLAVRFESSAVDGAGWPELARQLGALLRHRRADERQRRQLERWQTILDLAADWRATLDIDELLQQMAVASTKLLDCERATIFLWDRRRRRLIGRPALGVEGNQLDIPDDTGVVGRCVHRDAIERVDPSAPDAVDRRVDRQLGFHTRSLLCVPLHDQGGRVMGAFEAINKEGETGRFSAEDEETLVELARHASVALDQSQTYRSLQRHRDQLIDAAAESVQLIGSSPGIESLRATIGRAAPTMLTVLILGENGTGKEVVARMIHFRSPRKTEPFVAVNCAALAPTLLDSELFGHERGAFTDAHQTRAGKFEQASGGTLFLDEIGDLSLEAQAKLLRVLEQKVVTRVGGSEEIAVDVRLIAATNRDLEKAVEEGAFRQDLFFRLDGLTLHLPPLRDRGDDVLELADHFLAHFCREMGRPPLTLSEGARQRLQSHSWPGNVRELRNLMERLACLVPGDVIEPDDVVFRPDGRRHERGAVAELLDAELSLAEATRRFQVRYLETQIARAGGRMAEAARRLGMHRSNLYRKMKQLGMNAPRDAD